MPDGELLVLYKETTDFKIMVGCESYCCLSLVREALVQLPDFNGHIDWGSPSTPDQHDVMSDVDLVLIVTDKVNLAQAVDRSLRYKYLKQAHILIYLQNEKDSQAEETQGLVIQRHQLAVELFSLAQALFAPVIPQGLICIDWADTCRVLSFDGQFVLENTAASQVEIAIEAMVSKLRTCASGRAILGLQASILCHESRLATRYPLDLLSACREIAGEDATLVVSAPFLDWPDLDYYEVRLIAKVECTAQPE